MLHKDFVNGRETENELRSERPASVRIRTNVNQVRASIPQVRHLAVRMIAEQRNKCTVLQVVTLDLNMRKVCAKLAPEKSE
jgi:hypothetical protein